MRTLRFLAVFLVLAAVSPAQQTKTPANPSGLALPADLPSIPAFDITALDKTADPCVDFYKYACGGWMAKNPIPPDQTRWGRFDQLQDRNRSVLRAILEVAAKPDPKVYNNVDQMLVETRNLVKAIRENPKKYLTIHFKVF